MGHVVDVAGAELPTRKHINLVYFLVNDFDFATLAFLIFLFTMIMILNLIAQNFLRLSSQTSKMLFLLRFRHSCWQFRDVRVIFVQLM